MGKSGGFLAHRSIVSFATLLAIASGCSKQAPSESPIGQNFVQAGDPSLNRTISEGDQEFQVVAQGALEKDLFAGKLAAPQSANSGVVARSAPIMPHLPDPNGISLSVGIPDGMLGKSLHFGGVITKVSDHNTEALGDLKLSDLPAMNIKLALAEDSSTHDKFAAAFDCAGNCATVQANAEPVLGFPVTAINPSKHMVILDFAGLGNALDVSVLLAATHQEDSLKEYKALTSRTVAVDYSASTLTFDVESDYVLKSQENDPNAETLTLTVRWYLKDHKFNPNFVSRKPRAEVGFFTTDRSPKTLITRWDLDAPNKGPIKYFVKSVPNEHRLAVSNAFDAWNDLFRATIGKPIFEYEFLEASDPRNAVLVTGDVRYNIVEWDLENKASYGGLGPSIANQYTGETFTANVLLQGPAVETLYQEWFQISGQIHHLNRLGLTSDADALRHNFRQKLDRRESAARRTKLSVKLAGLGFTIQSQRAALEDPLAQRNDFDELPDGLDYATYMKGYLFDMLAHELGHNVGLRHNFRGNLGATDSTSQGGVSRSIMEYLGRKFRHLDALGAYDAMAVAYGYAGQTPAQKGWYCTDENELDLTSPLLTILGTSGMSAECSKNDATNDPVAYNLTKLDKALGLLVSRGETSTPTWELEDLEREFSQAVVGLGAYAYDAPQSGKWTNFFGHPNRPASAAASVRSWVIAQLKGALCDPALVAEAQAKATPAGQNKALSNLKQARQAAKTLLKPGSITAAELSCSN